MKFSSSLLENKEIRLKMFYNGMNKAKDLLKDIFGLTFIGQESRIIEKSVIEDDCIFDVTFLFNERKISAKYCFDHAEQEGLLKEILIIREVEDSIVFLMGQKNNFNEYVEQVMDYLEKEYHLNFTPLDPEDRDKKIRSITRSNEHKSFRVEFINEDHEGYFVATFQHADIIGQTIQITYNKEHKIYLD